MSELKDRKKLVALIRQVAKGVAYEVLEEHLAEDHKQKTPLEEEVENQ
jgi:hypothetical protein